MAWEWIAGAGSLAGSIVNAISNKKNTERTNDANREMQANANAFSEKMWNLSNEYNDPSNVVNRAIKAGINPNSILSGGTTAQASPMSGASASAVPYPSLGNVIGEALANALTFEQARGQNTENAVKKDQLWLAMNETHHRIELMEQQGRLTNQQASEIQFNMDKWTDALLGKTKAETQVLYAQCKQIAEQTTLARKQGAKLDLEKECDKVVSDLAKNYGIVVNGSDMQALVTSLMSPHGSELVSTFINNVISSVIEGVGSGVGTVMSKFNPFSPKKKKRK